MKVDLLKFVEFKTMKLEYNRKELRLQPLRAERQATDFKFLVASDLLLARGTNA
jgi:hypothetical protein